MKNTLRLAGLAVLLLVACDDTSSPRQNTSDTGVDMQQEDAGADTSVPSLCDPIPSLAGSDILFDSNGQATVTMDEPDACLRTYRLRTTAPLRDGQPTNPRVIVEQPDTSIVRSGNDMFDALYAMALEEVRQASVSQIQDGSFNDGNPVDCGGCFETGRLWKYVWTRDTAYAVDLGLALTDPVRAQDSLEFKLSERRTGGDLQIVQDTGTGGSYPVSTDRVAWALGAERLLNVMTGPERDAFAARAFEALSNTLEQDRRLVFDANDGLYRGEQSFLDWREQTYPAWSAQFPVTIAESKTLSTNVLHYRALRLAAKLASEAADTEKQQRYTQWADALKTSIVQQFWRAEDGLFSTMIASPFSSENVARYDLLGSALVVLSGVADAAQAQSVVSKYPHVGAAAPVVWPQQQLIPIYHNRAQWPFVTAYWLDAAVAVGNAAVAEKMVNALMTGAAVNLSNMENFEAVSGAAYVQDGEYSGPVVNSQRQIWSVAGYLNMVQNVIFGMQVTDGKLRIQPSISVRQRSAIFGGVDDIKLQGVRLGDARLSLTITLPEKADAFDEGFYVVQSVTFGGAPMAQGGVEISSLSGDVDIRVELASPMTERGELTEVTDGDWRQIFAPRTPVVSSVSRAAGGIDLTWGRDGESETLTFRIYKDGELAATVGNDVTTWSDTNVDPDVDRPCYSIAACFESSGNCSHHGRASCWWGDGFSAIQTINASSFVNTGGELSNNHGRVHFQNWGDPGHRLVVGSLRPNASGRHFLQVVYGNGAGGLTTGITCAVKRVVVEEEGGAQQVGTLVMPHLGSWDIWSDSNVVSVDLDASKTYTVRIESDPGYENMSVFEHFSNYTGGLGGHEGAFNRVNVAELKLLHRP